MRFENRDTQVFMYLIKTFVAYKHNYLLPTTEYYNIDPKRTLLGYYDEEYIYLVPSVLLGMCEDYLTKKSKPKINIQNVLNTLFRANLIAEFVVIYQINKAYTLFSVTTTEKTDIWLFCFSDQQTERRTFVGREGGEIELLDFFRSELSRVMFISRIFIGRHLLIAVQCILLRFIMISAT